MPLTKVQSRGTQNVGAGSQNLIINGAMKVAQRLENYASSLAITGLGANTSSTFSRYKVCDRWGVDAEGTTAGRYTLSQDSSAPSGFANSLKFACTTADTSIGSSELLVLHQILEGQDVQHFAKGTSSAKEYAVSFYVKGNASATYVVELFDADNSRHVCKTFSVTTDWTRVEMIFPADTTGAFADDNGESLRLQIFLHAGSNYNSGTLPSTWASKTNANRAVGGDSFFDSTSRTFFITGVQIEVGSQVSDFQHEPFLTTIEKCQRYYTRLTTYNTYAFIGVGYIHSSTGGTVMFRLPTRMRTEPDFGYAGSWRLVGPNADDLTSINAVYSNRLSPTLEAVDSSGHGESNGNAMMIGGSNDADAYIEFTAEL